MLRLIVASLAAIAVTANNDDNTVVSYNDYKLYEITPANERQLEIIKRLELDHDNYEYLLEPTTPTKASQLLVSPVRQNDLTSLLEANGIDHNLLVGDLQTAIDEQNPLKDYDAETTTFTWTRYHALDEINDWLTLLPRLYPGKAELIDGGVSYEGRRIRGIKISANKGSRRRSGVLIDGGVHAREWIAPATVTYLINELLSSNDTTVRKLADSHDWYLFPVVNPDGYVYTHTTNRLWRKTRSKDSLWCRGVDANRNWDYKWMTGGASNINCMPTYAGKRPFSEIETRTLSQYMRSIDGLFAYISFHSFSQLLLFPYGHTKEHLDNYNEMNVIAEAAVTALAKRHGTKYQHGSIAETLYVATGSSVDWAKGVLRLPLAYTYELRGKYPIPGFLLPAKQIIPNGEEVLDSLVAMFEEAKRFGYPRSV